MSYYDPASDYSTLWETSEATYEMYADAWSQGSYEEAYYWQQASHSLESAANDVWNSWGGGWEGFSTDYGDYSAYTGAYDSAGTYDAGSASLISSNDMSSTL
jgi:hypothetical protein